MKWLQWEIEEQMPAFLVLAGAMLFIAFMEGWQTALMFSAVAAGVYATAYVVVGAVWLVAGVIEAVAVRRHLRSIVSPFVRSKTSDNPYQSPGSF